MLGNLIDSQYANVLQQDEGGRALPRRFQPALIAASQKHVDTVVRLDETGNAGHVDPDRHGLPVRQELGEQFIRRCATEQLLCKDGFVFTDLRKNNA